MRLRTPPHPHAPTDPSHRAATAATTIDLRSRPSGRRPAAQIEPSHLDLVVASPPALPHLAQRAPLRVLDIAGAGLGLLILAPVFLVVALAVALSSTGPILFRQERVGRCGTIFTCLKFRTMCVDAPDRLERLLLEPGPRAEWAANQKLRNDPRVTPCGRVLRRFDLDELPQLWNVLRGEMSLVGPRPVLADEAERYGADLTTVLSVKPGMTGLWQISDRRNLTYRDRVVLDCCYVSIQSVGLHLAVVAKTLVSSLVGRNSLS